MNNYAQQLKDVFLDGTVFGVDKDGDEFAIVPDDAPESQEYAAVLPPGKLFWVGFDRESMKFYSIDSGRYGRDAASRFPGARIFSAEMLASRFIERLMGLKGYHFGLRERN